MKYDSKAYWRDGSARQHNGDLHNIHNGDVINSETPKLLIEVLVNVLNPTDRPAGNAI